MENAVAPSEHLRRRAVQQAPAHPRAEAVLSDESKSLRVLFRALPLRVDAHVKRGLVVGYAVTFRESAPVLPKDVVLFFGEEAPLDVDA